MSDSRSPDSDPSMDDILASIRKIISDDEARAQVGGQAGGQASGPAPVNPPRPAVAPSVAPAVDSVRPSGPPPKRDDVLLLTDLIEEPSAPPRPVAAPIPLPRIDPVNAAEMPQPHVDPMPERPSSPVMSAADQSLVGSTVAGAASSAFERLSQAMQESVPPPAASDSGPAVGAGGKTIEDMVKEMLRPMLKEWLDRNLPPMVERFVEREIVRLTRR
jgi:cell pole-organizing protein PopZ